MGRDVYGKRPRPESGAISRRALLRLRLSGAARRDVDYEGITVRVREGWERDGHEPFLRAIEPASEVVCELAGVAPGQRVLDAGAGDGNLALAAVRRGARVDACDLAPAMVERGMARSTAAGAAVAWRVADVQALPYESDSFDAVISVFGASLAPRPNATVRELVRVVRPGGVVALAAWSPRGLPGGFDALAESVAPLPQGVRPPSAWGTEGIARRRLDGLLDDLELRSRTISLRMPTATALFDALAHPLLLSPGELRPLRPGFDALLASCNNRPPGVEIDARFLVAIGRRP